MLPIDGLEAEQRATKEKEAAEQARFQAESAASRAAKVSEEEAEEARLAAEEARRTFEAQQALEREYAACKKAYETHDEVTIEERDPKSGSCTTPEFNKAKAEVSAATVAAEAVAKALAHSKAIMHLGVRLRQNIGHSSRYPGESELSVHASPYAFLTVRLSRHGHRVEKWEAGSNGESAAFISWSCKAPGGIYHWTVEARSGVGHTLTASGTFKPVSSRRCAALKAAEEAARERNRQAAEDRRLAEFQEEAARTRHFEHNCRLENGTPRTFEVEGTREIRCVAPGGGFLTVPQ